MAPPDLIPDGAFADVGVVVIGRNEGVRLRACLLSVIVQAACVVYVDSGSNDGSIELARALGAHAIALDPDRPFTAARARNEGWRYLQRTYGALRYVQFVDGDCELDDRWMTAARGFLDRHGTAAVVCGRRREKFPRRSVYNLLCDLEWDTPIGEVRACGGDAMMRLAALCETGGFRVDLIAGEEPELCVRLRAAGWRIWRLDAEMSRHDADMHRFAQWWRRALRSGHAFAEGARLHGRSAARHYVRESRRAWLWGVCLPLAILLLSLIDGRGMLLALAYPMQVVRLAGRTDAPRYGRWWRALFLVIGRFPEGLAQLRFLVGRLRGGRFELIEYK